MRTTGAHNAMLPRFVFRSKRSTTIISIVFISTFIIFTLQWLRQSPGSASGANSTETMPPDALKLPETYLHLHQQSSTCDHRLGVAYLEDLRHSRASYCSARSPSQLTCFHSQTAKDRRVDSFCIGQTVTYQKPNTTFQLLCDLIEPLGIETGSSPLTLDRLHNYWYDTGPGIVVNNFLDIQAADKPPSLPSSTDDGQQFTILVKREGPSNVWHSLMEIMSLSMTLDVLQMSPDVLQMSPIATEIYPGRPFLRPEDSSHTQVVILDGHEDGPFFDLWRLFAKKPTIRISELPPAVSVGTIIVPLVGGSNPVWQGDWEPNSCDHSELLRAFSRRVLQHLAVPESPQKETEDDVIVTFIDRRGTRKLIDTEKHTAALRDRYLHAKIQVVDLAELSFAEQVQMVHSSDVLAGVHGAGLTHALWLKPGSSVVEILPADFKHKGFRNLAGALGHTYFSTHGIDAPRGEGNWQQDDVALQQDRFLELMDVAIKSVYNKGSHNFDLGE